ncbi:MAG: NAD(P)H-hydrate dehydratase [Deltaproteobacteria bacterium]|nr:NAD(P)H-hydrate dehydratase [Deltaproteobacteria bacterium]
MTTRDDRRDDLPTDPHRVRRPAARGAARGEALDRTADAQIRAGVWPLVTAAEMQALDRETIEARGIPGELLMENAGRALVAPALAARPAGERGRRTIRAFCGAGNNGGDGFVAVRHLRAEGIAAEAILIGDPARLPPDAAAHWRRLVDDPAARDAWRVIAADDDAIDRAALFDETSVALDALFGTGLKRAIEGGLARWILAMNAARTRGLRVVAVDLPSGVSADTGQILGVAIEADRTVTISLPKPGLALEPGRRLAGRIEVARIGIADPDPGRAVRAELWNARAVARGFPARPRDGHKGRFGHVLVAAGSEGKWGAASLASRAALRAGAGLVTLVVPAVVGRRLPELCAEVMTEAAQATASGGFAEAAVKAIVELASARSVLAIGPGLGTDPGTVACVRRVLAEVDVPVVVDADGLNALVGELERVRTRRGPTVLTPHPGEAARLLERDAATLNADRIASARRLAERAGAIVVLKGAGTVVASPQGRALVVPTGGPLLASGGTGDVLTGVVAALLAAGMEPFEAAALGAWWHGAAGDGHALAGIGFGMRAGELADALPGTAQAILAQFGGECGAGESDCAERVADGGEHGAERVAALVHRFPGP